ncbi:MAG TPA: hypothetical protein VFC58_11705 [Desulfosporosinus sp.]|nr:hypothetical protein [Desulfosporosinus sp.]
MAIKGIFNNADHLIIREFKIGLELQIIAFAVMIVGLINEESVNENLIKPLRHMKENSKSKMPRIFFVRQGDASPEVS